MVQYAPHERDVVWNLESIDSFLLTSQHGCSMQEGTAFFPGSRLAGQGLLVSDGALWQRQRQLSNPAFRRAAVETYTEVRSMIKASSECQGPHI